jgi:hypothetical protein
MCCAKPPGRRVSNRPRGPRAETLAHFDIPHLIAGGLAVQEHGYHRVTLDVDLVVPDIPIR